LYEVKAGSKVKSIDGTFGSTLLIVKCITFSSNLKADIFIQLQRRVFE